MSLFKQIQLLVACLLLAMLVTVLRINFNNAREFTANQTFNNAKNVANVLALSLGPRIADEAFIATSINAMYDGGYYQSIILTQTDGEVVYQKREPLIIEGIPDLFLKYIDVDIPLAESQVMDGWTVFGTIQVEGHTGNAYKKLWATFKQLCLLFAVLGGAAVSVSYLVLKHLLRALANVQHQAEAISNNEFVLTPDIPETPELKKVVLAMNAMVAKVQTIFNRHLENLTQFQELRDKDAVTGLPNRSFFVKELARLLVADDQSARGHVVILGLSGMERLNISGGHPVIHRLYRALARVLEKETANLDQAVAARFPRQEFAILLPNANTETAMLAAEEAAKGFLQAIGLASEITDPINVNGGVAAYTAEDELSTVLSKVDYALSVARSQLPGTVERFQNLKIHTVLGRSEWRTLLEKAFVDDRYLLSTQPVLGDSGELHREVFISLLDNQGAEHRAGLFMPVMMSLGFSIRLDQYVLERTADYLTAHPQQILAVNMTTEFCQDRLALQWLRQFLAARKGIQTSLAFELRENTLIQSPEICLDLAGLFHGLGYQFGIDQFTLNDTALNLLEKLKPAYIKVERDYLEVFDDPGKTDMVLNAIFTITDSLDIKLIATKIESAAQRDALAARNITYFQGRGIAAIAPLGNTHE